MAGLALLAFLSLMFIVFLVAGITLRWGLLLVQMAFVAAVACQPHVLSSERVFCLPVVIKEDDFPLLLAVAIPADVPECACMLVVFLMTGITIGRCLVLVEKAFVAARADGGFVLPFQRVFRIAVVIESNELPTLFPMAGLALVAKRALVFVLFAVARLTCRRRFLFGYGNPVAFLAGDEFVRAEQEIFRVAVMIERRRFPRLFRVAGLAFHAKDGVMNVVSSVAGATVGLQFILVEMAGMTAAAGHIPMLLAQGKCGIPIMIESDLSPRTVRMAGLAFLAIVSFVHVVFLVARVTSKWRGPVLPIGMAFFAIDLFVLAE